MLLCFLEWDSHSKNLSLPLIDLVITYCSPNWNNIEFPIPFPISPSYTNLILLPHRSFTNIGSYLIISELSPRLFLFNPYSFLGWFIGSNNFSPPVFLGSSVFSWVTDVRFSLFVISVSQRSLQLISLWSPNCSLFFWVLCPKWSLHPHRYSSLSIFDSSFPHSYDKNSES
jgi:hypothetical protein